jgi:WD40 repeat protein
VAAEVPVVHRIAWRPDSSQFAYSAKELIEGEVGTWQAKYATFVQLVDSTTKRALIKIRLPDESGSAFAFLPSGAVIAVAVAQQPHGDGDAVLLIDVSSGSVLRKLRGSRSGVVDIQVGPRGDWLAAASADGSVQSWRVSDGHYEGFVVDAGGQFVTSRPLHPRPLGGREQWGDAWKIRVSPDGTKLAHWDLRDVTVFVRR